MHQTFPQKSGKEEESRVKKFKVFRDYQKKLLPEYCDMWSFSSKVKEKSFSDEQKLVEFGASGPPLIEMLTKEWQF